MCESYTSGDVGARRSPAFLYFYVTFNVLASEAELITVIVIQPNVIFD